MPDYYLVHQETPNCETAAPLQYSCTSLCDDFRTESSNECVGSSLCHHLIPASISSNRRTSHTTPRYVVVHLKISTIFMEAAYNATVSHFTGFPVNQILLIEAARSVRAFVYSTYCRETEQQTARPIGPHPCLEQICELLL